MSDYQISDEQKNLILSIRRGDIDINNVSNFFSIFIKAFIVKLNEKIKIRNVGVPHYIQHVGDIIQYLEYKNHDSSIEPLKVSNEDYIYSEIPRCNIIPGNIEFLADQITTPYVKGNLTWQYNDMLYTFMGEFRRIPIQMSFELTYILDSYIDSLTLIQQCISKLAFIQTFSFIYLGQEIKASYNIPSSYSEEHTAQISGDITESLQHTITFSLAVETYFPVYNERTIMGENRIRHIASTILNNKKLLNSEIYNINGDFIKNSSSEE